MANINGVNPPAINDVDYVDKITNSFNAIDGHDHTTGKGVPIGTTALADGSVTTAKLADNAVSTAKIQGLSITSAKFASGAVNASAILNECIADIKISPTAAIAYSKLNLAGSVNLASDITGVLSVARGGTALSSTPTNGQLLIGNGSGYTLAGLTGTSNQITVTDGAGSVTLSTPQSIATTSDVQFGTVIAGSGSKSASAVLEAASTTQGFLPPRMTEAERDLIGSPAAGLVVYNTDTNQLNVYSGSAWGAVGGGANIYNDTFTGTSIVATADEIQKWRYTGGSAQTLLTLDFSAMPDGGRLIITGSSNTNTLELQDGLIISVHQNGNRELAQYSTIEFIKDNTQLIEVSRNGI